MDIKQEINTSRPTMGDALKEQSRIKRFVIGLLGSAFLAYYVTVLPMACIGYYVNMLTSKTVLICAVVFSLINLVGFKLCKIVALGWLFGGLFLCYNLLRGWNLVAMSPGGLHLLKTLWMVGMPMFALVLNAYFFREFVKNAEL